MKFRVTAFAGADRSYQFEVFTPDLQSAIETAKGVRQRHADLQIEIRDPSGEVLSSSDIQATGAATGQSLSAV